MYNCYIKLMEKNIGLLILTVNLFLSGATMVFAGSGSVLEHCFTDGCISLEDNQGDFWITRITNGLYSSFQTLFQDIQSAAASHSGSTITMNIDGSIAGISCFNGVNLYIKNCPAGQSWKENTKSCSCSDGEIWNGSSCVVCGSSQITQNNSCVTCPAGQMPNATRNACVPAGCQPGTGMSGVQNTCVPCAANQVTQNNQCATCPAGHMPDATRTSCVQSCADNEVSFNGTCRQCDNGGCTQGRCNNGATNPPYCTTCNAPYYFNSTSKSCIPSQCPNNMTPPANYGQTCQGGTNACGQPSTGTIQCDGRCVGVNNNTCITSFIPNTTSIQPNGSVEFFYKILPPASGTQQTCGFYDRSQSKGPDGLGVPIPGLQNLDTSKERIRINNIQRNTEFCLVCRFSTNDGTPQAPAANHQWVRVIRIGEN